MDRKLLITGDVFSPADGVSCNLVENDDITVRNTGIDQKRALKIAYSDALKLARLEALTIIEELIHARTIWTKFKMKSKGHPSNI
jgi:hypothetical protein